MRILIVEDEIVQLESLKILLETLGHTVYASQSTLGAEKLAEIHPPDAVVLDIRMPDVSGLTFLRWMRTKGSLKDTPVAITTALPLEQIPSLEGLGPVKLLGKPFKGYEELIDALQKPETIPPPNQERV